MFELIRNSLLWAGCAVMTALVADRAGLWLLIRAISSRALSRHRVKAGGSNRLVVHGVNTADNCRTPMSIADAVICYCVYDTTDGPVLIDAAVPANRYWSLSCYGLDTACYYSLNHTSPAVSAGRLTIVLSNAPQHRPTDRSVVVNTPGPLGIVLIRTLLVDPADPDEQQEVLKILNQSQVTRIPSSISTASQPGESQTTN